MSPGARRTPRSSSGAAYAAAVLAFASAAVTIFWTLGWTWLLDTVGGSIEKLAKILVGFLALALVRPWFEPLPARLLRTAGGLASVILLVWGGANVCVGALVLSRVISPNSHPDERVLRWHVFVWDLWFVVWGAALAVAIVGHRRESHTARRRRVSRMRVDTHS